jgi:heterodisulfide reductase subunit A
VERDVAEEAPRVGVFVCHCGINIGGVVDVPDVVEFAASLPGVAYAERNLYTCSQDTQQKITHTILEHRLNRVVVASCTPRTHEPLFQDTLRQAGLNPHLFEMANIREQDAWVHRSAPQTATAKAKGLVSMAVAKAQRLAAIQRGTLPVQPGAMVIGGGLAGMTAALSIAAQGCDVTLVERAPVLGGNLRHIHVRLNGEDPQALLAETIRRVESDARITAYLESEIEEVRGYVGQFHTTVRRPNGEAVEVEHGAMLVATGARQRTPVAYGYGQLEGVLTQRELELRLANQTEDADPPTTGDVVMIQCVGSRDESHPYCSRVCCTEAIKNALAIKRRSPSSRVTILYRDLRSYGFREALYRQARLAGVRFLPFDAARPPEVRQAQGRLEVRVVSPPESTERRLSADLVVLSAGIEAEPGNAALSRQLKLPLNKDGFFLEAHVKLRPVDFAAEGVFLCGMAHSPRSLDETIGQAKAAAVRAVGLLTKKELTATPIIASVNPRLCAGCGVCVEVCPFGARRLDPERGIAEVVSVLCQGCGACVAACPNKASQQKGFDFQQVGAMLDAALLAEG